MDYVKYFIHCYNQSGEKCLIETDKKTFISLSKKESAKIEIESPDKKIANVTLVMLILDFIDLNYPQVDDIKEIEK